jgi:integrase
MKRGAYRDGEIQTRVAKTGELIWMPAHPDMMAVLDPYLAQRDAERTVIPIGFRPDDEEIILNRHGEPYTENGFQGSFFKIIRRLEAGGTVGLGLTFHGLRASCGTRMAETDVSAHQIMAILGLKTLAMAQKYTEQAERKKLARSGMAIMAAGSKANSAPPIDGDGNGA